MSNRFCFLFLTAACLWMASCGGSDVPADRFCAWGRSDCYDDFLWKKYKPDTLSHTLVFDFNDDARMYMDRPVTLGIFKKSDSGRFVAVGTDEMQLFVDGAPCPANRIEVSPQQERLDVGIVFDRHAADKVHYWYFKVVDNGGLDRINDFETASDTPDPVVMDLQVVKKHRWNPLAKGLSALGILLAGLLAVWFVVLRPLFYPSFRVGRIVLRGPEPYMSQHDLRSCYKFVLTSKRKRQGLLSRIFTGRIACDVNALWTSEVVIEPRDRKSVRIRPSKEYLIDARTLQVNQEYTLVNETTRTKTILKIS